MTQKLSFSEETLNYFLINNSETISIMMLHMIPKISKLSMTTPTTISMTLTKTQIKLKKNKATM